MFVFLMAKKSFLNTAFFYIHLPIVVALLFAYAAPYVSPENFWLLAFPALGYLPLLLFHIFLTIFWWLRSSWQRFFVSLLVLGLGWNLMQKNIAFNIFPFNNTTQTQETLQQQSIKLLTYNVRNFDLYNWTENVAARNKMMDFIREEEPDILCFQEFYTEDIGEFHNIKLLINELAFRDYHFVKTQTLKNKHHWGVAIFSRYPIKKRGQIKFKTNTGNAVAFADIEAAGQIFRVYAAHLQSIKLGRKDLAYVESIGKAPEKTESNKHLKSITAIAAKLKHAFIKRGAQARLVAQHIEESPYPAVLCGDFNDTPSSYTYHTLQTGLTDAFLAKGFGTGGTYNGPLPSLRIDYVLLSDQLQAEAFEIVKKDYSDHYPVSCTFGLPVRQQPVQ